MLFRSPSPRPQGYSECRRARRDKIQGNDTNSPYGGRNGKERVKRPWRKGINRKTVTVDLPCSGQGCLEDAALRDEIELMTAIIVAASACSERMSTTQIDQALEVTISVGENTRLPFVAGPDTVGHLQRARI